MPQCRWAAKCAEKSARQAMGGRVKTVDSGLR